MNFFIIIEKMDVLSINDNQKLPLRYVRGRKEYIGLRETLKDALDRFTQCHSVAANTSDHIALMFTFTPLGVAHYTTQCSGRDHCFASLLSKKTYGDRTRDWKVWHFLDDLPLSHVNENGDTLISSEFRPLVDGPCE